MIKFNSTESFNLLDQLDQNKQPEWGNMSPQHMVEHLTMTMKISVGKIKIPQVTKEEDLPKIKRFLSNEMPMPRNFKGVNKSDEPLPLKYKSMDDAKSALKDAIAEFSEYYKTKADAVELHPVFGMLNEQEWELFHNKHFTHHYSQFNLI